MTSIQLDMQSDKYLISLDKAAFDMEWLQALIQETEN